MLNELVGDYQNGEYKSSHTESDVLKLAKMVLNINDFNTCEFGDLESDVCIGQGYLQQMKELARYIIGYYGVC